MSSAPPLDWWDLPWEAVRDRLVRAMCPERVCRTCGQPSRRIVGDAQYVKPDGQKATTLDMRVGTRAAPGANQWLVPGHRTGGFAREAPTLGWSDCGHNDWRPGVVLELTDVAVLRAGKGSE